MDKRIKIILNSKNIGAGLSRNKAIRLAKGKYINFLDSDDLWNKKKNNYTIRFYEKNQCNISHTSYSIIDKRGNISGTRKAKNLTYNDLLSSCDIGLSTVMIKKILDKYSFVNLKTKEDYVLWLKLAQKRHQFFGINKKLTYWRNLDDSLSSSTIQKLFDGYKVYRKYLNQSIIQSFISLLVLSKKLFNKMIEIFNYIFFVILAFLINLILKKNNFLINNTGQDHQTYTVDEKIPLSGGVLILIFFYYYYNSFDLRFLSYLTIFFFDRFVI